MNAIKIHAIVARDGNDPWQIVDTAPSMPIAKGKVIEISRNNPGVDVAYAVINKFGDFTVTDYRKRSWIERQSLPISGACGGLVNSNDDSLRG